MAANPGEEFNIRATPSQELLRRLAHLAAQDNDSVLTGGLRSSRDAFRTADGRRVSESADFMVQMARLADPAYQALSRRIEGKLERMDEASVYALQEIEQELAELRRQREAMLEQAYQDDQGRRIFVTADGSAGYYQDGEQVGDDEFARMEDALRGRPTWEKWKANRERLDELSAERDMIHRHDAARDELRDDLAAGRISDEEAERREREIEQSLPERVRRSYADLEARQAGNEAAADTGLSAGEAALLNARVAPAPDEPTEASAPDRPTTGAPPFQPG